MPNYHGSLVSAHLMKLSVTRTGIQRLLLTACCLALTLPLNLRAQQPPPLPTETEQPDDAPQAPDQVEVQPVARDSEIEERLQSILDSTEWFQSADVEVRDGVAFISGSTNNDAYKTWAGDLARNTQDVAAVVNEIEVVPRDISDFSPVWVELNDIWRRSILAIPYIGFAIILLTLAWWGAKLVAAIMRRVLAKRLAAPLLREFFAKAAGLLLFLIGLYLVLRVSGLTRLAVSVLGGTGLAGLIIGIAFRDITENFLASMLLSMQQPFRTGDLVEINGIEGHVQSLTARTTILLSLDGNHVQIPNATVYKSVIRNFTSNPRRRVVFDIGIGYDDAIAAAQEVALHVLANHPAVLKEPEPWVLVENLGTSTVNLRVYFWINSADHNLLKVKSSVIRLVKRAFQENGVSMPDEAREMIFPKGVQVELLRDGPPDKTAPQRRSESAEVSTKAEAGLQSDADEMGQQARLARQPEEGENLLERAEPNR